MDFGYTNKGGNQVSLQNRTKIMTFLLHHLYKGLKTEYLIMKDFFCPLEKFKGEI